MFRYWKSLDSRIGTPIVVNKKGVPHQGFSSKYWAGHVGGKKTITKEFDKFDLPYRNCSKNSVGLELGEKAREGYKVYKL